MVEYLKFCNHQLVSVRPSFLLLGGPLFGQTLSHLLGILKFGHFIILLLGGHGGGLLLGVSL